MLRFALRVSLLALAVALYPALKAFSLLGPVSSWQTTAIGYPGIIGPKNINEEFRWNVPTLYYSFDNTFLTYFGTKGVAEVERAIKIMNDLPSASNIDLANFPAEARRSNLRAQALNLMDLRSVTLALLLERMGVEASPRYVYTLHGRNDNPICCTSVSVTRRNFDPDTFRVSSYINNTLYTYRSILCGCSPVQIAYPINVPVDPLASAEPVSAMFAALAYNTRFGVGQFYTGLTKDDVGGLRYIYRQSNVNYESVIPLVTGGSSSPWSVPGATNIVTYYTNAVRFGVEKLQWVRVDAESLLGETYPAFTNRYSERVIVNGVVREQQMQRTIDLPDMIFVAADLALDATAVTVGSTGTGRTITFQSSGAGIVGNAMYSQVWSNLQLDPVINGAIGEGPGLITGPNIIAFNSVGPLAVNFPNAAFIAETNATPSFVWGSFDSSTNITIYPDGASIMEMEAATISGVVGGLPGGGSQESPWIVPAIFTTTTTTDTGNSTGLSSGGTGGGTSGGSSNP